MLTSVWNFYSSCRWGHDTRVAYSLVLFSVKEDNYVQSYPFKRVCCFSVAIHFLGAVSPVPHWFSFIEGLLINPWYSNYYISWIWSNFLFLWLHPHWPLCYSLDIPAWSHVFPFSLPEYSSPTWLPPHHPEPCSLWPSESSRPPHRTLCVLSSFSQASFSSYHLPLY